MSTNKEVLVDYVDKAITLCDRILDTFEKNKLELAYTSLEHRANKSSIIASVEADWKVLSDNITELLLKNNDLRGFKEEYEEILEKTKHINKVKLRDIERWLNKVRNHCIFCLENETNDIGSLDKNVFQIDKNKMRYTIFVSSTYKDLIEERQALTDVLLSKRFIPIGMEQFNAAPVTSMEIIKKMIDECDYYLLLIGGCYGSIDNTTGKSYTEAEYEYAKKNGIPIIAFLPQNPDNFTMNKMDKDEFEYKQALLNDFKKTITQKDEIQVAFYDGVEDLKVKVMGSLDNLITLAPRAGWIHLGQDSIRK